AVGAQLAEARVIVWPISLPRIGMSWVSLSAPFRTLTDTALTVLEPSALSTCLLIVISRTWSSGAGMPVFGFVSIGIVWPAILRLAISLVTSPCVQEAVMTSASMRYSGLP